MSGMTSDMIGLPRQVSGRTTSNSDGWFKDIQEKLSIESKIKEGAENLLEMKDKEHLRKQAELELDAANAKIQLLQMQLRQHSTDNYNNKPNDITSNEIAKYGLSVDEPIERQESPTWSLGDILQSMDASKSTEFLVDRANDLVSLLQRHPLLKYDLALSQVGDKVRILLLHTQPEVVASGYRIARHAITDLTSLKNIRDLYTDYLIVRTLTKDSKSQVERVQAMRLIRAFLDIPGGVCEISVGVTRAIVAVAEQSDDRLRAVAIETLTEILIYHPRLIASSGGSKLLIQSLVDGPYELSSSIAMAFVYALNRPDNRVLFRNGRDLEYLVSPFTEIQIKGHVNTEKLTNCAKIIASLLRTWPGLYALSVNNFHTLDALISSMYVTQPQLRNILLDMFLMVFCIQPVAWSSSFLAGRRLTTFGRVSAFDGLDDNTSSVPLSSSRYMDHMNALLLQILNRCGLIRGLSNILETDEDATNIRKTTLLLGELLAMSGKLLPIDGPLEIGTLPSLFSTAMSRDGHVSLSHVSAASAAVFQIEKVSRNLQRARRQLQNHESLQHHQQQQQQQQQLQQPGQQPSKMGAHQIDDATFKQLIMDTQVLTTKNYTKWRWDILADLIQGPLLNSKRLEEAIRTTKFLKRLLSFYRPFKYRFSSIKKTKPNQKYVDVGCMLVNTLMYTQEGVRYLTENKLLRQIAECLAQLDPMSGITSPEPLFSSQRLENTLSYGYFRLLGTLSSNPRGIAMMERWRMFNMIYHLTDLHGREDLITGFISSMDYSHIGHPRIIMSKTLTTGQRYVRLYATSHLRKLTTSENFDTRKWAVNLLAMQLYDPDIEVCKITIQVLEEFCNNSEDLEHFVSIKPSLDHLGEIGTPLLLRFLSTSKGFQYLKDIDYIHGEMDNWLHGQNDAYVSQMEEYLESTQSLFEGPKEDNGPPSSSTSTSPPFHVAPRHFFGELTLTEEGCQLLRSRGYFDQFAEYISEHRSEHCDAEIVVKLKGYMWAVGHIASNPLGAPLLEESGAVETLIDIFNNSELFDVRGTAFYVLGLISSTYEGVEILDEFGWTSVRDIMGQPQGICLPMRLSESFSLDSGCSTGVQLDLLTTTNRAQVPSSRKSTLSSSMDTDDEEKEFPTIQADPVKRKILSALTDLSNQILANEASRQLVKLETKYPTKFTSVDLFVEAMKLLETYHYKLPVRRFIFELFDMSSLLDKIMRKQKELHRRTKHPDKQ